MNITLEQKQLIAALVDTVNRTTNLENIYNDRLHPADEGAVIPWTRAIQLLDELKVDIGLEEITI